MNSDKQQDNEPRTSNQEQSWSPLEGAHTTTPSGVPSDDIESRLNAALESTGTDSFTSSESASTATDEPSLSTYTTSTSEQPTQSASTPIRKGHKGLVATIVILVILLLAVAGTAVYLYLTRPAAPSTDTKQTTTQTETPAPITSKAQTIVESVRTAVTDQLKSAYPDLAFTEGTYAPAYKAPNTNYAVTDRSNGHAIAIEPTKQFNDAAIKKVQETAATVLEAAATFSKTSSDWQTVYSNADVVCALGLDGNPVSVSCGDVSIYANEVSDVAPFAAAYLASTDGKKYGDGVIITLEKINEKSDGYKNAQTGMGNVKSPIGGYAGLFYYDTTKWVYWRGTQSQIDCADFNTHALQKSFEGTSCYDQTKPNDMTTVVKVTL